MSWLMQYHVKSVYKPLLFLLDFVGSVLFFWTKLFSVPQNPARIIVMRFDHAGDMVMTLPVFVSLRKCFPNAKVCVLCRSFLKDFVEADKNVDEVFVLDVPWFSRDGSGGWIKTLRFLVSLRNKFDVVIELHADPRNIFAAFIVGGFRFGYGTRGFGFLLNKVVKFSSEKVHAINQNLAIIESIGCRGNNGVVLPGLVGVTDKIKQLLSKNKIKKFVVVHPAAARSEKLWLNDRWAAVIDKIIDEHDLQVVITGAGVENNLVEDIRNRVSKQNKKFVFNAGGLCKSFLELAALIKNSELVVSVDTVAVHLAHALKVPVIGLYGPTDPVVWGYDDKKSVSIYKKLSDKCGLDCRTEYHRVRMMQEVSVDDVMVVVEKLLLLS